MRLPKSILDWEPYWRELWEERAALMQFEAGLSQPVAEIRAEQDVRKIAGKESSRVAQP